jgi:hypothetical protein
VGGRPVPVKRLQESVHTRVAASHSLPHLF